MQCPDCHREVSDQAEACPHCGRPLVTAAKPVKNYGCGTLIVGLITLFAVATCWHSSNDSPSPPNPSPASAKASDLPENAKAVRAAQADLRQLPGVRNVEWVDGELTIAVHDNGGSWEGVAESSCAWLRSNGFKGDVAVTMLDAGALRSRRWKQLSRVRCS